MTPQKIDYPDEVGFIGGTRKGLPLEQDAEKSRGECKDCIQVALPMMLKPPSKLEEWFSELGIMENRCRVEVLSKDAMFRLLYMHAELSFV